MRTRSATPSPRVIEEDPSISFRREAQTKEFLLSGTGQLHVEVTVAKLERKYGVHVILKPPKVPYRETITGNADVHGRHKKQTGGTRSVRGLQDPAGRASPRDRIRVRERDLRRVHPQAVHSGRGEGNRGVGGEGVRGRVPGGGLQGHPLRRQLPRSGLLGDGLQDCRVAGFPEGHGTGPAGAAGTHHEGGGLCSGGKFGRHHGAT